ncbi:hypothetical protein H2200_011767 [Cladophialophora chaetospira]|uniref:Uncharacterized protein n=1 Tax=Cladophialophora chaetospira TaxID=386627 RepID=A0AA38WYN4_9EURO|nr:hypothetical protein H2200_011767 [Cladophialophora chaetospira]
MAEVNGISKHEDTVSVSHLGKRKRNASPEPEAPGNSKQQTALQDVLQLLRKHDTNPSLLKYPLPAANSDVPELKRARLVKAESTTDTIEDRILTGTYHSLHALKDDVKNVHDAILIDASDSALNGTTGPEVEGQLSRMLDVLEQYSPEPPKRFESKGAMTAKADPVQQKVKQFLSLRSVVNGNANMLFSGLQVQQEFEKREPDALQDTAEPTLPSGFELTDFSTLGAKEVEPKTQEKRTFEKVFTTARRLKTLDLPHAAKDVVRGNTLDFVPNSSRAENLPLNKHDYKFARLSTGSWLSYHRSQQPRKRTQSSSFGTDFKAALAANNVRQVKDAAEEDLYTSVYSSFAPSSDNAYSLVSEEDLSSRWWSHHGEQKVSRMFKAVDYEATSPEGEANNSDEFADLAANFEPEEEEANTLPDNEEKEVDDLLGEVSEMIETLSSYQRNRSLDHLVAGKLGKPEKAEFDVFEMLKDQLSILVAGLPPFAVAKLNGDQLEELNISTRVVVEVPDYPGTGLPDDLSARRQRTVQQAAQNVARPAATPQPVRPNYSSIQANTMNYNSQHRNYSSGVPATSYGMRTTQNYQTPGVTRPTYAQTPTFQASTATQSYSASRPTIQQFQRPGMQNGYSSFGNSTPLAPQQQSQTQTPGTGFAQRPSQPGYQQRAQDNAAVLARSASPQKPQSLVNGAAQHYTPRQYQAPNQTAQTQQTASYTYPRQGSATSPITPIAPATMAARYDGQVDRQVDRPTSAQSGGTPARAAQNAAPQAHQQGQTVEVSR